MKKFIVALALFLGASVLAVSDAQALHLVPCNSPQDCDRNPEHLRQFVRKFYTWYIISECENDGAWWLEPVRSGLKHALAPAFYKNFNKIAEQKDADPVLYAQDCYDSWFYPDVTLVSIHKETALFLVRFPLIQGYKQLYVKLRISNHSWLVDEVHPDYGR